jgi:hypothetical protein
VIIGVIVSLVASACFSVSNLMEKSAVGRMPEISARRIGHLVRQVSSSNRWVAGFALGVAGVVLTVLAYTQAPIVVVQTIIGAGLALLVFGSRLYLQEPLGAREYVGLAFIIIAVVLVALTLSAATLPRASGGLLEAVAVSAGSVVAALIVFRLLRHGRSGDVSVRFGVTSGVFYGVAALQAKGAATLLQSHGLLAGVPRVFESPYPYLFVVTSVLGLLIFQSGLQRSRISVVGPISSVVASIYVVVVGTFVFHASSPHDVSDTVVRALAFVLALGGVWVFATLSPAVPGTVIDRERSKGE